MNRILEEEIIEEILRNEQRGRHPSPDPCCAALLEHPWPAWVPELARRTPDEALRLLGSSWGGLAPSHAEEHLKHLGLNCPPQAPAAEPRWKTRWRSPSRAQVFVIRGRGEGGAGSSWIAAEFLTPGDLVLLSEGETVPADIRLLRVHEFRVDETALTGDPNPVAKATDWAAGPGEVTPTAIPDICFCGTQVVAGTATGMVVATGGRTLAALLRAS